MMLSTDNDLLQQSLTSVYHFIGSSIFPAEDVGYI